MYCLEIEYILVLQRIDGNQGCSLDLNDTKRLQFEASEFNALS